MTDRRLTVAVLLLAASPLYAEDEKVPALKKVADAVVKQPQWLAVSDKGDQIIVCAGTDVQIRDAKTLKLIKNHRGAGNRAAFVLSDKSLILSGVKRNGIELFDRESYESTALAEGEPDFAAHSGMNLLAYRAEGKQGERIIVHDVAKKKALGRWEPGAWVSSPGLRGFSAKGVLLGDCIKTKKDGDRTLLVDCVLLWAPPFDRDPRLIECGAMPDCVALAPDGKTLALGHERKVDVWDLGKGKKTASVALPLPGGRLRELSYSPDGKRLAALVSRNATIKRGLEDKGEAVVRVYDAETLKTVASGEVHASPGRLLVWLPDGKGLVTAGRYDDRVRIWTLP